MAQKMLLWTWAIPIISLGLVASFFFSLFVTSLSSSEVRFILWVFLGSLPILLFVFKKLPLAKRGMPWILGLLMGACSGLTGLGGGILLSPLLHENQSLPSQKIAPLVSVTSFFLSFFALLGQEKGGGFFSNSAYWWICCAILIVSAVLGLSFGQLLNRKAHTQTRRFLVRVLTFCVFCMVSLELWLF